MSARPAGKKQKTGSLIPDSNFTKSEFTKIVRKAKEYIRAGDIIQVVLSQRFRKDFKCDPFDIYRALRSINPSPYMFYLKYGSLKLITPTFSIDDTPVPVGQLFWELYLPPEFRYLQDGGTVTFGEGGLTWVDQDAPVGTYVVGFVIEDLDGNRQHAYEQIQVQ